MGKTLLELFENKDSFKYGTVYSEVKSDKETLVEQETSGVRIRSAVELNNPLIYGNEATRIATRSNPLVEDMKGATGGEGGDGGLIGKGLEKITGGKFGKAVFGGKVSSLAEARNGINTKLFTTNTQLIAFVTMSTVKLVKWNELFWGSDSQIT